MRIPFILLFGVLYQVLAFVFFMLYFILVFLVPFTFSNVPVSSLLACVCCFRPVRWHGIALYNLLAAFAVNDLCCVVRDRRACTCRE